MVESVAAVQAPRIYAGDVIMRRDDDLIRNLMLDFEANDSPLLIYSEDMEAGKDERVYFHLKLLVDSGFLDESGGQSVFRMTNAGHDFCAAVRDETAWRKIKDASALVAGASLGMMRDIGIGYLRAKVQEAGFPLG